VAAQVHTFPCLGIETREGTRPFGKDSSNAFGAAVVDGFPRNLLCVQLFEQQMFLGLGVYTPWLDRIS